MKFYLGSKFSRHEELQGYATELKALGHTVTSQWLSGERRMPDEPFSADEIKLTKEIAEVDFVDILAAQSTIIFTENDGGRVLSDSRGGRHVEFGIALGRGQKVYVVGGKPNVFYYLPRAECYDTWEELKKVIEARS